MAMVLSAIIGSLVLALSGCSDQSGQTEKTLRVGVITYSQDDPFINALTDELKAHLKTMESEERRIIVSIKSGNDDQQEQNEKVEEMIDAGCDVLCVNLVDRTAPYRIIRMARNEKIPVIFFNREPVKEDLMQWDKLYYVGCDAEQSGIMQGEIAAEYINSHPEVDKNEDGKIQFVADLPVDSRYYIKELAAPDGYVTDQEPQEFTFEYQGSGTSVAEYAFTFEDEQTTVELSKADLTDKKELPGASLKVTDEDGNTVDEWVSKEEAHIIKGLIVGKKYKMTETKPADGYVTAESIEFTVENTKEVQKHQMLDDVTKVEISKKDITDSSEVPGAKLIILDKDGKKVESWTSTDKPHMVEKLPVGEYTLREEQAPDGYLIAEDVKFTVKDTGKVQKVKMKDAHPYGKLVIKKTDSTSKAALSGAEFELREKESGKVVEKLVTDKTGTATSGKLPIATYKNGKVEKTVEYILVETKAPNGYELSSKKEEIRFEYKDGKTKVIEIVKEIKNTKSPSGSTPTGNSPKTGDSTNIWLPILLAVLSACGIGGVIWYKKKKGN